MPSKLELLDALTDFGEEDLTGNVDTLAARLEMSVRHAIEYRLTIPLRALRVVDTRALAELVRLSCGTEDEQFVATVYGGVHLFVSLAYGYAYTRNQFVEKYSNVDRSIQVLP